jgi:hypothetical protein
MKEPKKATGSWTIELVAICPHCDEDIDLMNYDEWYEIYGRPAECPEVNEELECPHCKEPVIINKIEY